MAQRSLFKWPAGALPGGDFKPTRAERANEPA
jgi:hypothetical protein